jgi:hypothetical protein
MKWTKTPPTKPGWYWERHDGHLGRERYITFLDANDIKLDCYLINPEWSGPILEPEE